MYITLLILRSGQSQTINQIGSDILSILRSEIFSNIGQEGGDVLLTLTFPHMILFIYNHLITKGLPDVFPLEEVFLLPGVSKVEVGGSEI